MQGVTLSRRTIGAFLLAVFACWLLGVQQSLVWANPVDPCQDCACKEAPAWAFEKATTANGYRIVNGDGSTTGVNYARLNIGVLGGCTGGTLEETKVKVHYYKYFTVNQTCKRNQNELIEYTYSDSGAKVDNAIYLRESCKLNPPPPEP